MVRARQAPVKPRVFSPESGTILLLEDEVRDRVRAGARGRLCLLGPAGAGKTTALEHLAAVLQPETGVRLLDEPAGHDLPEDASALVVYTDGQARADFPPLTYHLAPWSRDDQIEYLLAVHKERCAAVMARLGPPDQDLFDGVPEVTRIVLDQLAGDDAIPDGRAALYRYLQTQVPDTDLVERVRSVCLNSYLASGAARATPPDFLAQPGFPPGLVRVLRHAVVRLLLASDRVAADLHQDADCDYLSQRLPRELVEAVARDRRDDPRAVEHLEKLMAGPTWSHAMSASLLLGVNPGWVPPEGTRFLRGAYLQGACWPGVQLPGALLFEADLSLADLTGANLEKADALRADLRYACLAAASLGGFLATEANLEGAQLCSTNAEKAGFGSANLRGADLEDAQLAGASFCDTRLGGACLRGAHLKGAFFSGVELAGADFSGADLEAAFLTEMDLRGAHWSGASFRKADLAGCNLEEVEILQANFRQANLEEALLTGSVMPKADFTEANLCETGLADVQWEGACLRYADLRGASFHLGSSRSGMLFTPIASEGSRTGFYTDDYEEQTFKAPEEIRKANLCGADLRGAYLDNVDFYLVDLRGALYDPGQEAHLRHCGAILGEG